ncbi:MAG: corrinoid protein [Deltaproteobacteria bacterium]|nr:corrinoid protein [Deltaproteobacteria bacterium]MBW2121440.1 corrinoid protein [Deltaproteobacteria bacterium]
MEKQEIMENLARGVVDGDPEACRQNAREALREGIDPLDAVEQGLSGGMGVVGDRFERGEVYLPELLMAADAFNAAMEILRPEMEAQNKELAKIGTVLLGTVKGDVHNIGKNIVATVLETRGFSVVDMGVDIPSLGFIEEAKKVKADVIALSSLMTTSMPAQREVIETLKEMNLRDRYLVIVGGGPVSKEWADQIGADGYGKSAVEAVQIIKGLLATRG